MFFTHRRIHILSIGVIILKDSILQPEAVARNLPLIPLGGNHKRLLEWFGGIILKLDRPGHLNDERQLRGNGVVNDRLRVQGVHDVLRAGQLLEILLDVVLTGGTISVPHQQTVVHVEPSHLVALLVDAFVVQLCEFLRRSASGVDFGTQFLKKASKQSLTVTT